jgi:hypothetical protein
MPKKPTSNPVHESINHITVTAGTRRLNVRVWRDEEPFSRGAPKELESYAEQVSGLLTQDTPLDEAIQCVSESFASIDRVSAVEVMPSGLKTGTVYYPDWR